MLWTTQFAKSQLLDSHAFAYEKIEYGHENKTEYYVQMVAFVERKFPSVIAKYATGG